METKYSIVKQAIKSKILDGTYQPHQRISSESELMKQFGVSRHTVRQAIGDLVNHGWLYREQGSGTYCADRSTIDTASTVKAQKNIAMITTYISDYIFPSIIRGAEAYLSKQGYQVSLFSTNNNHESEKRILETILTKPFDGVIIEPTKSAFSNPNIKHYLSLERSNIPVIMINAYYDELEPIHMVMNDEAGGYLQTEHLLQLGHKNILGFFKTDDIQGAKRMKGYLQAHRESAVPIDPCNIITYMTEEKDTKPLKELQDRLAQAGNTPTAIVCYNDELALKLVEVLRQKDIRIPDDMSIVGYDDSFLAHVSEVKLTTVAHPKSEMGELAAKHILTIINKNQSNSETGSVVFEPELIVRHSTKQLDS